MPQPKSEPKPEEAEVATALPVAQEPSTGVEAPARAPEFMPCPICPHTLVDGACAYCGFDRNRRTEDRSLDEVLGLAG